MKPAPRRTPRSRTARSVVGQFVIATAVVLVLFWLVGAGVSALLRALFGGNWFGF